MHKISSWESRCDYKCNANYNISTGTFNLCIQYNASHILIHVQLYMHTHMHQHQPGMGPPHMHPHTPTCTVFIQIVAAATINFSLAWVRLLIEGSSYSRVAFINFGPILDGVFHKNCSTEGWFMKTVLRVIEIRLSKKLPRCSKTKPRPSSVMVLPRTSERALLAIVTTPT